jgi:hypothetical protein
MVLENQRRINKNMKKIFFLLFVTLFLSGCSEYFFFLDATETQIIVNQASDLQGELDSTKVYVIDGLINMNNISIIVPPQGLALISSGGGAFGVSGLFTNQSNYTLFSYDNSTYSGDLFISGGLEITLTGDNSTIYDLNNKGNFGAVETNEVNYNACSRIGVLDSYRQVLSQNVAIFGCDDGLEFKGVWAGGARLSTVIVRGFGENGTLFKKGEGLVFNSRFLTDANVDLGTNAVLLDFNESNFAFDSLLQLKEMTITRNGTFNNNNSGYLPNIDRSNIKSQFSENVGIKNTFVGGVMTWDTDTNTPLTFNVTAKGEGLTSYSDLQHFTSAGNNSLQFLGERERQFEINGQIVISNGANDQVEITVRKYINSTGLYEDVRNIERKIINAAGAYDVAIYDIFSITSMNQFDVIEVWIRNKTDGSDAIIVTDSFLVASER